MTAVTVSALSLVLILSAAPTWAQPIFNAGKPVVSCPVGCKDGTNGRDGVDGKDGKDGRDGKDAPPPVVIRETPTHWDISLPVPFVVNVDRFFAWPSATPDRAGLLGYYFRSEGHPWRGRLVLVDITSRSVLAIDRGGEVPMWSDVTHIQERTLAFNGPDAAGQAHACLVSIGRLMALRPNTGWLPLSAITAVGGKLYGSIPVISLTEADLHGEAQPGGAR